MTTPIRRAPERTCLGCRHRDQQVNLLRVALVGSPPGFPDVALLQPDPGRRESGRGAYVHLSVDCVHSATKRRAFGRALRTSRAVDAAEVVQWIERHNAVAPR